MASTNLIVSRAHRQLLTPATPHINALFPGAKSLTHDGVEYAVIPHTPREVIMLRTIGIEAPAPILSYYDWNKGTPFAVQKTTAALMTSARRCFVLNDMGTGKTRSALWAWHYLRSIGLADKLLVVAPLSTLKFTWARECVDTVPGAKVVVLHATTPDKRKKLLEIPADIYIINHEGIRVLAKELYERTDIDTLVLDELAVYRNRSQRTLRMQTFADRFTWAWGMTGRPMPNEPTDVFYQCKILTPHNVPKYFRHAQSILMQQVNQFLWVPKPEATQTALSWMQPAVRFSLDDVVELPESISRTIDVELSPEQQKGYTKLRNEFALMVKQNVITAANSGVAFNKLLQLGSGYVYTASPSYITLNSEPRQQMLLELLEQAPHKVIVFAPWRHLIDNLSLLLDANDIEHAVVHGDTKHRDEIFSDYQLTTKYRVLLCHPGTMAHGITLTAATTCIWYSPIPSLELYEQANARIFRYGQQHRTQFLHLQATAVERRVYTLLRNKQRLQDEFLTMMRNATETTSEQELKRQDDRPPPGGPSNGSLHTAA